MPPEHRKRLGFFYNGFSAVVMCLRSEFDLISESQIQREFLLVLPEVSGEVRTAPLLEH
jgi:hypothetical protein